ncbi:hypothetical protein NPIL_419211 [Nephila pilipes]|uniref:Uncharacterized protein n=1 Tax=Nephila pilipes TaxID=299642 RepID=A0A8X6NCT9_NEPPI|nr:hypothetical protein NPIL_419211 [Nephila pilipes]
MLYNNLEVMRGLKELSNGSKNTERRERRKKKEAGGDKEAEGDAALGEDTTPTRPPSHVTKAHCHRHVTLPPSAHCSSPAH